MKMRLAVLAVSGALFALLNAGCGKSANASEERAGIVLVDAARAGIRSIRETIPVDGTVVVREGGSAKLAPVEVGRISKVFVREGDKVQAGQLLAEMDVRVQTAQSLSAKNAAMAAAAHAGQADMAYSASSASQKSAEEAAQLALETAISEKKAEVQQAEDALKLVKAGARKQEIDQARESVRQATVTRDRAKRDSDRDSALFEKGYISAQQAEASRATYENAESALKQAQAQLAMLEFGARSEEINAAENKLRSAKELGDKRIAQARANLRQVQQGRLSVSALQKEAGALKLEAAQKSADAAAAWQTAANGGIRAPFSGYVGRSLMNPGDLADPTTPVFEIVSASASFDLVGSLSPEEAGQTQPGLVALDPTRKNLTGKVVSVGHAVNRTGLVPVRIRMSGAIGNLQPGEFLSLRIVRRTLRAVVAVPREAVLQREDSRVVFVVKNGVAKRIEIRAGPEEAGYVAILEGVNAGDVVVLIGQHELADNTAVEVKLVGEEAAIQASDAHQPLEKPLSQSGGG